MYRPVTPEDFEGKTIKHANTKACNCIWLTFTDGTELQLDTTRVMEGLYAIAVYVDEKKKK